MSFKNNLGGIRAWGREVVLPVEQIKALLKTELFDKYRIEHVIDFGAGTLYWSNWLQEVVRNGNIYPVDIIFKDMVPDTPLRCFSTIDDIEYGAGRYLFFTCDVLHHLSADEWEKLKVTVYRRCDFVVIKDMNCHFKFKNRMNKMHDRIINGEKIRDVDPDRLMAELQEQGYQCSYRDIHKLWYPHFIIIAVRKEKLAHA